MTRIITQAGEIQISDVLEIELEQFNPIFTDEGDHTATIRIPNTPHNAAALGYPHRLDLPNADAGAMIHCALVEDETVRRARINITAASPSEISLCVGLESAATITDWRDTTLRELLEGQTFDTASEQGVTDAKFIVYNEQIEENETIYGFSPDMSYTPLNDHYLVAYLWRVIELLFQMLHYRLDNNPVKEDTRLAKIVLLNNSCTPHTAATAPWTDLLPDATVSDILQMLRARFGLIPFFDDSLMTVRFAFLRDILSDTPQADLTPYITTPPTLTLTPPQRLTLANNNDLDYAAPLRERLEDITEDLGYSVWSSSCTSVTSDYLTCQRNAHSSTFYKSPINFKWDKREDGIEAVSLTSPDHGVAMGYYVQQRGEHEYVHVPIIVMWTGQDGDGEVLLPDLDEQPKENTPPAHPLALAFRVDFYGSLLSLRSDPFSQTSDGCIALTYNLKEGLYERFFRPYDNFLRRSNNEVEFTVTMPRMESQLVMWRPIRIQGQNLLIESVKRVASASDRVTLDIRARTIRPMNDAVPLAPLTPWGLFNA